VPNHKQFRAARKYGFRSGLEHSISIYLKEKRVRFEYETLKIEWEDLAYRTYTPDFILPNGIIIESKGMFTAADRRKHVAISRQHPDLDIRFVFESSKRKLRKGAKSTYGEWCTKYGFRFYDRIIPEE
jgi:Phage endonuclease I.